MKKKKLLLAWNKMFSNMHIKKQLYTIYFLALVLPIMLGFSFLLVNSYKMLKSYHQDLLTSDNQRVRNVLFEITTQIYNISENLIFDEEIQSVLQQEYEDKEVYKNAVNKVKILDNFENNYSEIESMKIYSDNPKMYDYKQFERVTEDIKNTEWYKKALSQTSAFWREMSMKDEYGNVYWNLCLVRKLSIYNSETPAVLVIKVSDNYLRNRLDSREYITEISVDEGRIFYSSRHENYGKNQIPQIDYSQPYYQYNGVETLQNKKCFATVTALHIYQSDSRLYVTTYNDHGFKEIYNIQMMYVGIILLAIIIPGLMVHFFTSYFTSRVNVLRQEMNKASRRDYELIQTFQGNDELTDAFGDLKIMVQNIKEQEAQFYKEQLNKQELMIQQQSMEFQMLASQINPHFLYNTLETIRMRAFKAGDREVANGIKLLGKSMRYVLENTGTAYTTLEEELTHIKTYIQIQKLRFGDRINSEIIIEDGLDISRYKVLPLLLQPVVENAIIHGLENDEKNGTIQISIKKEQENLLTEVIDNGEGMDTEELSRLRENIEVRDTSRSKSIGLYNINQRILLCYGEPYKIQIFSKKGKGTKVCLTFPLDKLEI